MHNGQVKLPSALSGSVGIEMGSPAWPRICFVAQGGLSLCLPSAEILDLVLCCSGVKTQGLVHASQLCTAMRGCILAPLPIPRECWEEGK